jgi:hypothetical protein
MGPDEEEGARRLVADLAGAVPADSPLRPAFELLAMAAAAQPPKYPVETLAQVAGLLRQTQARLGDRREPADVAQTADAVRSYAQPNWQVDKVFNVVLSAGGNAPTGPATPPSTRVPFVLAVMTGAEAEELVTGRAFDGYSTSLRDDFGKLREVLDAAAVDDWAGRYGRSRPLWRPFGPHGGTLAELVDATLSRLNTRHRYQPALAAEYVSITEINEDRWGLRRLRHDGCILIVDSISMRHPRLQRAFHRSLLDAYPTTSVVAMAPVVSALDKARELAVVVEMRLADLEFARRRLDPEEDVGASYETVERPLLEQWLSSRVRSMAGSLGAESGIRQFMKFGPGGGG